MRASKPTSSLRGSFARARSGGELRNTVRQTVLDGLRGLALLGSREAKRGNAWTGSALEWTPMDFAYRRAAMRKVLIDALGAGAAPAAGNAVTRLIDNHAVLAVCDAIPAAVTVAAARELVGQPFLRDHQFASLLSSGVGGPVHFVACHRGVTEAQGLPQVGFPEAIIVSPPFGLYVADEVQKIQMLFLADCRDPTTTRSRVDEAREWLDRAQEAPELRRRAEERSQVLRAIASVQRGSPDNVGLCHSRSAHSSREPASASAHTLGRELRKEERTMAQFEIRRATNPVLLGLPGEQQRDHLPVRDLHHKDERDEFHSGSQDAGIRCRRQQQELSAGGRTHFFTRWHAPAAAGRKAE